MFSCAVTSLHHASCWGNHLSCCLFVCLNHVKWYSFLLGGTFTFYASFRVNQRKPLCVKPSLCQVCRPSHCSVVAENGQMFFLSHLPDFCHDILCCVAPCHVSCPYAFAAAVPEVKIPFVARQGVGNWLCVFTLNVEIPHGSVLYLLCKYWQILLWVWMIYSLGVYES